MTLPDERFRAVIETKNFLAELIDPKKHLGFLSLLGTGRLVSPTLS